MTTKTTPSSLPTALDHLIARSVGRAGGGIGFDRFVAVCMACHRFKGEGEGTQGPDLATPMNPVDYFKPEALRKFLRDPASVRHWPDQKMPAFPQDALSDTAIDAIVAWLSYKAKRRP